MTNERRPGLLLLALIIFILGCAVAPDTDTDVPGNGNGDSVKTQEPALAYPRTRTVDQVDDYHGTKVQDPYRWLEDDTSDETRAWVEAENALTFSWLDQVPQRAAIRARLRDLWNFERFGIPEQEGGRYFFSRNDGLQNQPVLYVAPALDAPPRVLLDPNGLSKDGTVSLGGRSLSDDGKLMAYGLSSSGSDWERWKVRNVDTGEDLDDQLDWIKFSGVSWGKDGKGFYYGRYDEPGPGKAASEAVYYQKLYYHELGKKQSLDRLICKRDDQKDWGFEPTVTEDGRYLVITVWKGTDPKNQVFFMDLSAKEPAVQELLTGFESGYEFLGNDGARFWFKTNAQAPRGRIVAVDSSAKQPSLAEVVPQAEETMTEASLVGDSFLVSYLEDAHTVVRVFDLSGKHVRDVPLPGKGTASGFSGKRKDHETFFDYTDYTTPRTIFRYDIATGETQVFKKPSVRFDPASFETREVFYKSKDGTRVPLWIVSKKGLVLDGNNPTLLYGYGGFDISITPELDLQALVWMEMGGVFANANLRGGGEYGEEWHEAGKHERKQNVFDDFMGAAEYLLSNGYTKPERLAIQGGSNGGLLVGACLVQRPDLFGAVLADVGVMDMLRFHRFTIGWAWVDEYGSSDDAAAFPALRAYSPYHNVKPGTRYPAVLVTTGDHDDRVVPGHSFKFAAALQAAQAGPAPILLRVETKAGHGGGKPTDKAIDVRADQLAFLVRVFGLSPDLK